MKVLNLMRTAVVAAALSACANTGTLGDVLGGVLNAPNNQTASGYVQSVDTRSQTVYVRQNDGSTLGLAYDNRTQVVYNNQNYSVTALESGDQVQARVVNNGNGSYYTDYIQVTQSASTNNGGTYPDNGGLYSLSGSVRSIDTTNGYFTLNTQSNGVITVTMPYNPRSADVTRFRNLRIGDWVQVQGVYVNQTRFELRSFY